jgi:mannose-1-phosphate guanylyltransferase / mannose-6-phosphate isomerase
MKNLTQEQVRIRAVILAGGSGTRLWPLSRMALPKQFLSLGGDGSGDTLLEATVSRLDPIVSHGEVMVVTAAAAAKGEALLHLSAFRTLLEPAPRNTAPAIGVAALQYAIDGIDPVMVVLPADHVIRNVPAFQACLRVAIEAAAAGKLVTFGIAPTHPETGFGYIKAKAGGVMRPDPRAASALLSVDAFKEKPDLATAERFLRDGNYYWNSGMFVWKASAILAAIEQTLPALHATLEKIRASVSAGKTMTEAMNLHFAEAPAISIDHGVLEKVSELFMVPADIGWSDVGSWDAVYDIADKDNDGNAQQGNVLAIDCRNTLVRGGKRLIAAVGMEDVSIIETPDAILVARHGASQKVKAVVDALKARGATEHIEHVTVQRPWGTYTVLEEGPGFKIKRIEVKPGGRLSLQSHKFRSEHWVVVSGEATVTNGGTVSTLRPNESTFIPIGAKHRLENHGELPVQIIEVQVGGYVGEDDIERFEDSYGRKSG